MTTKPWTVIETVPESAFLAPVARLGWITGVMVGLVMLLAAIVTGLVTWQIVKPVQELTQAAHRLAGGELDRPLARFRFQPEDELGTLLRSFEAMRASLQDSYEEIHLLLTLTQAVAEAPGFQPALEIALQKVCESTGWVYGEAWIPDPDEGVLKHGRGWYGGDPGLAQFNQASQAFTFPPEVGLPGRVWSSRQPEWIRDVSAVSENFFLRVHIAQKAGVKAGVGVPVVTNGPEPIAFKTGLGVPVLDREEVVAVLVFFSSEAREEDEHSVELVAAVATQLGSLFQRKRAEDETRRRAGELAAIAEVGGLVTAGGDLQATLDTLARKIAEAAGFERVRIGLYDAEKEEISFPALFTTRPLSWLQERKGATVRLAESPVLQRLLREGQPVYFDDPPGGGGGVQNVNLAPALRR